MKGAFGLVALMITMFIVAYLWSTHTAQVVQTAKPVQERAQQWSGRDESGMRASDSIKMEAEERNGSTRFVTVTDIIAAGPMEKYYGLKVGDKITHTGSTHLSVFDGEMARLQVLDAYQRQYELKIIRDGQEMTLPVK